MKNYKQKHDCLIGWLKERAVTTGLNKKEKKEEELNIVKKEEPVYQ